MTAFPLSVALVSHRAVREDLSVKDVVEDRRRAVECMSAEDLRAFLGAVPAVAEALEGRGPLAALSRVMPTPRVQSRVSLGALAAVVADPMAIDLALASVDRFTLQLATLARWRGGSLPRKAALAEVGAQHAAALDAASARLAARLLADPRAGWLVLRPGVAAVLRLPGMPVRDALGSVTSDTIANRVRALGVRTPPMRKADRIVALERRLRDPQAVRQAADRLAPDTRRILDILLRHGSQRVREDLGLPAFTSWYRDSPLRDLVDSGLVGVSEFEQVAWVWLDVFIGLNGGLFPSWEPDPPPSAARPLLDPGGLPPVLSRLAALLALWRSDPPPVLSGGGMGVRPVRAAAKALSRTPGEVGLLAHLAERLGLLAVELAEVTGRGRNRNEVWRWAVTPAAAVFAAEPAQRRWALLVQVWRDDTELDEGGGLPERLGDLAEAERDLARAAFLRVLAGQPEGTGLTDEQLCRVGAHWHPGWLACSCGLVAAARVLGLIPEEGPAGLTGLARALLAGVEVLTAALPPPVTAFTVQGDGSVVAPPDLAPDVSARLERYATLESAAGARLYRIAEARIAAALDAGETGADVLGFLTEHSTAALPQNLEYLVRDCERRHGRLRVGTVASYLRCDDPALLTRAATVKAARLRLLAPTVAVSELARDRVAAALRSKGLLPVAEAADGSVLRAEPAGRPSGTQRGAQLPALRPALEPAPAALDALVARLQTAPKPQPEQLAAQMTADLDAQILTLRQLIDGGGVPATRVRRGRS